MRGMVDGAWHRDVSPLEIRGDGARTAFATPAARVSIDVDRLARAPESFHLYAARACPFAHRVLLARALLGLDGLRVTYANPWLGGPDGWHFPPDRDGPVARATRLWEIYAASDPAYTGRVTVPVLWDREAGAIASAESREILRALLGAFAGRNGRFSIAAAEPSLQALCDWVVDRVNLGVYRIGFSRSQDEYDAAHAAFSEALHLLNDGLGEAQFLWNDTLSLADLLLFPTAIRFDTAYQGAFQILDIRWRDFARLQAHLERVARLPGVVETVAPEDYRRHYFDDSAFPIRHAGADGHYIVPRTPDPY